MKIRALLDKAMITLGYGEHFQLEPLAGGDTAMTVKLSAKSWKMVAKIHENPDIVLAEADGLSALRRFVRVPDVHFCGEVEGIGLLLMEFLPMTPPQNDDEWKTLGSGLARLHSLSRRQKGFGFGGDNFLGGSPQANAVAQSWPEFFARRRLLPQIEMARHKLGRRLIAQLACVVEQIDRFVPDLASASLVHGDLWSGNVGISFDKAVFFDPACYYGDPDVDLAMMRLFGTVPDAFYLAYQRSLPDQQQRHRWRVYDLYHLLNHFNLYGDVWRPAVSGLLDRLSNEAGNESG